ncbi:MAG: hypothetical protein ABIY40_06115 [Rhodanobacteraceae bacterium]
MIELGLLGLLVVFGVFWLFAALIGAVFKLIFGLIGGFFGVFGAIFGGFFAVLGIGIGALVVVPIVLFALLPLALPVLILAGLIWLIVRTARPAPAPIRH